MSRALSCISQAFYSLTLHPLRSFLTMASVAFGAAVLFILLAYSSGVPEATASILRSLGGKEFIVEARRSRGGFILRKLKHGWDRDDRTPRR